MAGDKGEPPRAVNNDNKNNKTENKTNNKNNDNNNNDINNDILTGVELVAAKIENKKS